MKKTKKYLPIFLLIFSFITFSGCDKTVPASSLLTSSSAEPKEMSSPKSTSINADKSKETPFLFSFDPSTSYPVPTPWPTAIPLPTLEPVPTIVFPTFESKTLPPTTPSPTEKIMQIPNDTISVESLTTPVSPGEKATIAIVGKPNTKYSITVRYNSGNSTASGLYDKTSDGQGYVSWTWKVGTRTSPGTYKIRISGGGESFTTTFTVL